MRYDSDLDILLEFNPSQVNDAWSFVEAACAQAAIDPDIHDAATSKTAFIQRAVETGISLP